ncbi:MAG: tetratricopeptide repeat protein [Clostridium sp.]|uniref:tetratricopeptide repeat protein n=1 Tax=Clostridium sp. TaxID=1506 RepID=UPI003F410775
MDKWGVLGIEKTKDKDEVREGYMKKLPLVHPEEDPEGFKLLRNAYEEALKFCEEEEDDESELDLWMKEVDRIYKDFSKRVVLENWKEVLDNPLCISLESSEEARNKLLNRFLSDYYVPQEVLICIDEVFNIREKKEELYELFPEGFVDFIINEIVYGGVIDYSLFKIEENKDYDKFLDLYFEIRRNINSRELENIEEKFEEIKALDIYHPYLEMQEARRFLVVNEIEKASGICDRLVELLPDDIQVISTVAEWYWEKKDYENALEYYRKGIEINSNNYNMQSGVADCLLELEEYDNAKTMYRELNRINPYDDYIRNKIYVVNEKIIEKRKADYLNLNYDERFNLAWLLFENYRYDETLEVDFTPKEEDKCEYYDLIGRAYLGLENYSKALDSFNLWIEKIEKDKKVKELDENEYRVGYAYVQKGKALEKLERLEEALKAYEEAILEDEEEKSYLNYKCSVLNKLERYEETIEISSRALEEDKDLIAAYINRGVAFSKLGYDREALDDAEITIGIYPYILEAYLINMRVFEKYSRYEEVLNWVKRAEELGIDNDEVKLYRMKSVCFLGEIEEAYTLGNELLEKAKKREVDEDIIPEVNFEMAIVMMYKNFNGKAMAYIDKAIKLEKENCKYINYKAYICRTQEKYKEAIEIYERLIELDFENSYPYVQIGYIYDMNGHLEEAIKWYEKGIEVNVEDENAYIYLCEVYEKLEDFDKCLYYANKQIEVFNGENDFIYRGALYASNGMIEEALEDYFKALEINENNEHAYNNIGCIYKDNKDYIQAIKYFKLAIEKREDKSNIRPFNNIARCYIAIENFEKALKYYDLAIQTSDEFSELHYSKGMLLKRMRKYEGAFECFNESLRIDEKYIDSVVEICEIYIFKEEYEKAIEYAKKILKLEPEHEYGIKLLLDLYLVLKNYKDAIIFARKMFEKTKNPMCQMYIGRIQLEQNKKILGTMAMRRAIREYEKERGDKKCTYKYIGECYALLGEYDKAIKNLDIALNDESKHCIDRYGKCMEAYIEYGKIYLDKGDIEKAMEYLNKAEEMKGEEDVEIFLVKKRVREMMRV